MTLDDLLTDRAALEHEVTKAQGALEYINAAISSDSLLPPAAAPP